MDVRRSNIKGSINLSGLSPLDLQILKLEFLNNWTGVIRVVSRSKSVRDSEGRVRNYSNKDVMKGIRKLVGMNLLESR